MRQDSSTSIVTRLGDGRSKVSCFMPGGGKRDFFSLLQNIQNAVLVQPTFHLMGTGGFPRDKADWA